MMPPHPGARTTALLAIALCAGCGSTPASDTDAGPFRPSYDPDGDHCELPPACGDEPLLRRERPSEMPIAGVTLSVESVVPEGEDFRVSFASTDRSVVLPAEPPLEAGDEVSFEEQRGALVLLVDGEWVALVSSGALGEPEEERALHEAMEEAHQTGTPFDLDLLGVPLTLEVGCGGWQGHVGWNNGCSDVPTVAFAIQADEGAIPLGAKGTITATDGREVVVENRGIMVDVAGGEDCLRCLESITATCGRCADAPPHGFRIRMVRRAGEARACSGLPTACASDAVFTAANPAVFGVLTTGEWTVSQTLVADARPLLELQRGDESISLDLPADPAFEDGETVMVERGAQGVAIESADGTSAVHLGPNTLPGDAIDVGPFTFEISPSCGGWVPHHVSPDLCPVEAAEALTLTLEGTDIAPGEIVTVRNVAASYAIENRGVFRTVENSEPGDECAGCADPPWGRSAVLIVRSPR